MRNLNGLLLSALAMCLGSRNTFAVDYANGFVLNDTAEWAKLQLVVAETSVAFELSVAAPYILRREVTCQP